MPRYRKEGIHRAEQKEHQKSIWRRDVRSLQILRGKCSRKHEHLPSSFILKRHLLFPLPSQHRPPQTSKALSSISTLRPHSGRFSRPSSPSIKLNMTKRAASSSMGSSFFILAFASSSSRPFPPLGISCRVARRHRHHLCSCKVRTTRTIKNTDPLRNRKHLLCRPHDTPLHPYYRNPGQTKEG